MFLSSNKKNIDTNWLKKAPYQELWEFSKIVLWDSYFWQKMALGLLSSKSKLKIVTRSSHFGPHFPEFEGSFSAAFMEFA